jgi:hypothetical protein
MHPNALWILGIWAIVDVTPRLSRAEIVVSILTFVSFDLSGRHNGQCVSDCGAWLPLEDLPLVVVDREPPLSAQPDRIQALVIAEPKAGKHARLDAPTLIRRLLKRDTTIRRLRSRIKNMSRRASRRERKSQLVLASSSVAPETILAVDSAMNGSAMCARTCLALGIRRNLSNIASKDGCAKGYLLWLRPCVCALSIHLC